MIGKQIRLNDYKFTYGRETIYLNVYGAFKNKKNGNKYVIYSYDNNRLYFGSLFIRNKEIIVMIPKEDESEIVKKFTYSILDNKLSDDFEVISLDDIDSIQIIDETLCDFNVDMSFHTEEIATMLSDYENDAHTGMDIGAISEELYHYTSGYPYLVSWLCKWIDEEDDRNWSKDGVRKAGKALLKLRTPLFDDLIKNVEHYEGLKDKLEQILSSGEDVSFSLFDNDIAIANMFGIVKEENGKAVISNILFESCLYDYFGSKWSGKKW